jgi:hypothetical protein
MQKAMLFKDHKPFTAPEYAGTKEKVQLVCHNRQFKAKAQNKYRQAQALKPIKAVPKFNDKAVPRLQLMPCTTFATVCMGTWTSVARVKDSGWQI